jgi:hypothetical protein
MSKAGRLLCMVIGAAAVLLLLFVLLPVGLGMLALDLPTVEGCSQDEPDPDGDDPWVVLRSTALGPQVGVGRSDRRASPEAFRQVAAGWVPVQGWVSPLLAIEDDVSVGTAFEMLRAFNDIGIWVFDILVRVPDEHGEGSYLGRVRVLGCAPGDLTSTSSHVLIELLETSGLTLHEQIQSRNMLSNAAVVFRFDPGVTWGQVCRTVDDALYRGGVDVPVLALTAFPSPGR